MNRSFHHMAIAICIALTVATSAVTAQERPQVRLINDVDDAAVRLHPVTPYLESSSVVLVDVDLAKVNIDAMLAWLKKSFGMDEVPENMTAAAAAANGFSQALKGAGVEHLYVGLSTRSLFDRGPIVVIPCKDTTVVKGLVSATLQNLPPDFGMKVHVGEELVLVGPESTVDRVVAAKGAIRPDLILPTKGKDRLDHTLVVSLPDEARGDLVALWPERLPEQFPLQFSPRALAKDINRFVVSWTLPPNPAINIQFECEDTQAAIRVSEIVDQAKTLVPQLNGLMEVKVENALVDLSADPKALADVLGSVLKPARDQARSVAKMNQMKQLGLAMHNYHAVKKQLPPRHYVDRDSKPLLSWRVALLPFLNQKALYDSLKLDEAFDSDANATVSQTQVPIFDSMVQSVRPPMTTFRAPVFPGSVWHGDGPPKRFRDVKDGTSNTIVFIDAPPADAVGWADPTPWEIDTEDPLSDIFGDRDTITAVIMDGSVRVFTREDLSGGKLEALLTIDGGEVIE
ncbi:MAG: DUF1559 domain-containing protein [Planctomycetota bacterium]